MKKTILTFIITAGAACGAFAQVVTFSTASNTAPQSQAATFNATQQAAGVSGTPQLSRTTLTPGGGAAGSFFNINANTGALNLATNYVGFAVAPSAGNVLFATGINWTSQGSNTAPNSYATAYSTDGFATSLQTTFTGTTVTTAQARSFDITDLITNDTLTVRLYNYGATSINNGTSTNAGSFRVITPTVTGSTVSAAAGAIALAANTEIRDSGALTLGGTISGSFGVTKTAAGTLTLSGSNSYTGGTTISGGKIIVTDASALGTGALAVGGGNTLEVGNSTTTKLTLNIGGTANFNGGKLDLNMFSATLNDNDAVATTGLITLDGSSLITLTTAGAFSATSLVYGSTFDLIDFSSILTTGFDVSTGLVLPTLAVGKSWDTSSFTTNGTVTVVPEPSEYAVVIASLLGVVVFLRRRKAAARA